MRPQPTIGAGVTAADWSSRLAGALLVLVGGLNVALGLMSLLTDQIHLSPGIAGGLVTAGLVTAAVGALVWRGNRLATILAFTVFAMLLLYQLSEVIADNAASATGVAQPLTRFGVLAVLVITLGIAAWRSRRASPTLERH
jgi:hypothetical protein